MVATPKIPAIPKAIHHLFTKRLYTLDRRRVRAMAIDVELDQLQKDYKVAVEEWIGAIRQEEALASVNHSVADVDEWEHAADAQEQAGDKAKTAKEAYEAALREEFFNF
jgi:hypothetical protein